MTVEEARIEFEKVIAQARDAGLTVWAYDGLLCISTDYPVTTASGIIDLSEPERTSSG